MDSTVDIDYNGDRECPDCEQMSLVESGLTQWECLHCGQFFDDSWFYGEEE